MLDFFKKLLASLDKYLNQTKFHLTPPKLEAPSGYYFVSTGIIKLVTKQTSAARDKNG